MSVGKEEVTKRKKYSAPALEKGLDVIELLANEVNGLETREITQRLNRSMGEIFRMIVVLEQRGWVYDVNNSGRYALTLKAFEIAHRFPPVKRLTSIAGPVMLDLAIQIEQSCHLVIYYEGKGHVVVQQDSPSARVFGVRLGAVAPLLDTCSGHILLSFADDGLRRSMLSRVAKVDDIVEKKLESIVRRVTKKGYENIKSEQIRGVQDIGFPVFDYTGRVVAALVVPYLAYLDGSHLVDINEAIVALRAASEDLSAKLGYLEQ